VLGGASCPPARWRYFRAVALIGQEVLQRGQKERSKPPAQRLRLPDHLLVDELAEEALSKVFSAVVRNALAPKERVERIPVALAEIRESGVGVVATFLSGPQDETPVRRRECRVGHAEEPRRKSARRTKPRLAGRTYAFSEPDRHTGSATITVLITSTTVYRDLVVLSQCRRSPGTYSAGKRLR
jgi:hypothetical protein